MDSQSLSSFEDKVRLATQLPVPRPEFVEGLWNRIAVQSSTIRPGTLHGKRRVSLHPAWLVMGAVVVALIAVTLVIGPARVYAAVRQLLGYIPGIGIVDENVPIRVLSEPVSVTRDGITITVTSGFLTGDRTHIEYRIFGVPRAAYPDREDVVGCVQPEYLRLPDGTRLELTGSMGDMPPVPATVDNAVFVLPCIANTLPGAAPENWELGLIFVPAPPEVTVLPVVDLPPSSGPTSEAAGAPTTPEDAGVTFERVIETSGGYILIGRFQPSAPSGEWVQVTDVQLRDASGRVIEYTSPPDIEPPNVEVEFGFGFVFEFNAAGLSYPLSLTISGVTIRQADPNAKTEFEFDAGPNPQPGQEWVLNQDLTLAGHSLTLASITADSRGYSFDFKTGPDVFGASVAIPGSTPIGGGGSGSGGLTDGTFSVGLDYAELPTGRLRVTVSNLSVIGDKITWRGHWSPASARTDWPTPTPQPGLCAIADTLQQPAPAPADLVAGAFALTYEQIDAGTWGLVLYSLDGRGKEVLVPGGTWGTLSPNGDLMAYPSSDGIHVLDLETRAEIVLINGLAGYDLHWSPDGQQIAFVGDMADSVYVIDLDGTPARPITDQAYASVIGWSPDSAQVYVAIPFTGGSAWKVRTIDAATGEWRDLFTIENGTRKFLSPALSPDGQWIAYRGADNSSLYRVRLDGADIRLLMTGVGQVVWSGSGWMGVTTLSPDQLGAVLLQAESCRAYTLPSVRGYLLALYVP